MSDYKLYKELKEAGFPQKDSGVFHFLDKKGKIARMVGCKYIDWAKTPEDVYYEPTLEELIEAVGDRFDTLVKDKDGWQASAFYLQITHIQDGKTPQEAVANLYLALMDKEKIQQRIKHIRLIFKTLPLSYMSTDLFDGKTVDELEKEEKWLEELLNYVL